MDRPSKYHQYVYVGKNNKGADESGHIWSWDPSHPELEPTSTFSVHNGRYCSYCCSQSMPIQSGLRKDIHGHINRQERDFAITGYTCICEAAENEKELRHRLIEMRAKHIENERELVAQYKDALKHDKRGRLELQYREDLRSLEFHPETFRFEKEV